MHRWYVNLFMLSCLCIRRQVNSMIASGSTMSTSQKSYFDPIATSLIYEPVPAFLKLEKVVVFCRHGDRSQISRGLGTRYPPSDELTRIWSLKLPDREVLKSLVNVAKYSSDSHLPDDDNNIFSYLYSGWDNQNIPYGHLTSHGVTQMKNVGKMLALRYRHMIFEENSESFENHNFRESLLLRTSNSCRTIQSLRSLLVGFYDNIFTHSHGDRPSFDMLPIIRTTSKEKETLFPQVNSSCEAITVRRGIIMSHNKLSSSLPDYDEFEKRVRNTLDINHIQWLSVKEVVTCHHCHGLSLMSEFSEEDEKKLAHIAAWLWGRLFNDKIFNRYAIGRLLTDIRVDLDLKISVIEGDGDVAVKEPKLLIYSGHDSTLVPVMCALDIYDEKWPAYASYLALEIARSDSGERYIRAVYNNEIKKMFRQNDVWYPYESFLDTLKERSISYEQFDLDCVNPPPSIYESNDSVVSEAELLESRKEMEEEIQATLGKGQSEKLQSP